MSPLDLGSNLLDGTSGGDAGDTRDLDTEAENGWRAIWRVVQTHKDRQTLERKAAKEVRGGVPRLALGVMRLRFQTLLAYGHPKR